MKRISMLTGLTLSLAAAGLSACSSTQQPIVDTKGVNSAQYNQDNYECQQYANQVSPVGDAAVGAVGGAAGGAALGAITRARPSAPRPAVLWVSAAVRSPASRTSARSIGIACRAAAIAS